MLVCNAVADIGNAACPLIHPCYPCAIIKSSGGSVVMLMLWMTKPSKFTHVTEAKRCLVQRVCIQRPLTEQVIVVML